MRNEKPEIGRRRERSATLGVVVLAVITVVLVVLAVEHTGRASASSTRPVTSTARAHHPAASPAPWLATSAHQA